uniref:Integrase, catalytic region, zinc finger, CCHC-type, peptidase aspartic, catalytic n=1 Tax=Tanacetum cinerariifolium TaxID=118510 RepID=A0A6L2LKF5_TANCI|nr:integrase, catalytic region, zinc finger, CCHC-type, peptidase aspartic, catalytic [Tanacetum cinerariifolium]
MVHMLYKPRQNSNELKRVVIGYKNPLCLTHAKQAQPALYNGHEIIKDNHIQAIVHNSKDTLEIAKITRKKMNDKMNDPECVTRKVKIAPHDYSKENLFATFTPQKQLTPEQIFWSNDLMNIKFKDLKERTKTKACYLQEVIPFFKTLKDNFKGIQKALTKEVKEMKDVFEELEAELKYQNLKDQIGNSPPTPDKDTLDFDSVFVIGKMQASLQGKDNVIRQLKKELSQLQVTRKDTDCSLRVQTTDSQITKLTDQVTHLQAQNDMFRAENDKIKQHYKELYDSIKITRAKRIEQVTKVTTENMNLKTGVSKATVNPLVSIRDKHAIDVKPIVPRLRNNRNAHLDYLRHLKESVEMIRDIVEEAKVVRPLDRSIVSACRYTKHSQELLEYAIGTCPHGSQPRAKQLAHIPLIRKKKVIVAQPSNKLDSTTHLHVVTVTSQKTNVLVPPSTGVDYKMADVNAPSDQTPTMAPPVCADDQILPHIRWIPIRNSNCYVDLEKSQSNQIYKIAVDLLKNTNFFRKAGCYKCQLDEQWFDLSKETLREALQITLVNRNQAFTAPPLIDGLIDFVNQLGYPKLVMNLSTVVTNDLFQPWRALLTIINLCLMRKTSGFKRPRAPVLQILWGIVTRANIDYAERIWEEFTQSIHTFIEDKRNLSWHTSGKKRAALIVIPSIRFTKLIIHHLQRKHKFHPRPDSPPHLSNKEPVLGYLKFSAKGTKREIFGMPIPGRLITANIREASYYQEYQENVDKHRGFLASEIGSTQDLPAPKPAKPARKPQSTAQKAPLKPSISSPAVKESMKDAYALPKGPLPPVVIREPESGKYQPLPEVPGKGKAKVSEEQRGGIKKDPNAQAKDQTGSDAGAQAEGQARSNPDETSEGQAGSNPDETSEGQAGSNPDETSEGQARLDPGNAEARVQSTSSLVVHAGSDREHIDLDVANVSSQPSTEPESPKEHQQLKATTTDTTTTTTTTLPPPQAPQQSTTEAMMVKRISELEHIMADLIQVNKTMEERLDKHGARLYTLEQLDIPQQVNRAVSEVVTDAVDWAMQAPLRNCFRDLPEADMKEILHQRMWESDSYKSHEDHMQLFEALEKSINRDHSEELTHDLVEARKKRKKGRESQKTPPGLPSHQPPPPPPPAGPSGTSGAPSASESQVTPPPPPPTSTNQDSQSKGSAAPSPSKTAATTEHQAWTTPGVTLNLLVSLTPEDLDMDEAMGPDEQAQLSDEEDIGNAHIPTVNLRQGWWKPFEAERPTTSEPAWSIRSSDTGDIDWFCKRRGITELKPQDLEGPTYEIVKVFHPDVIHLQYQMEECHKLLIDSVDDPILRHNVSKPLPLKGPPGQVTIQSDFFFNKDLEYIRYSSKGRRPALSISKMKEAYYPDAGIEQMVPDHVVRIEVFSMYGYDYMKKIVLCRADLNEHVIVEREFMYMYPSDFEDLNLLNLQGHLNHLLPKDKKILTTAVNQWTRQLVIRQRLEDFQLGIESYQTQVNLTKPQWMATGFEYKHDYTVIESPRAVIFRDKYGVQMMMHFNEIHKFSDGTLQ